MDNASHIAAEHSLLRDFFNTWQDLHAVSNDRAFRSKKLEAAEKLIEIQMQIERMIDPVSIKRTSVHES